MRFDLIIRNGQVVDSRDVYKADVAVHQGRIALVGDLRGWQATEEYDASGKYVFPGFIDEHVHSRDPGLTHKEDFAHSTRSAAAGGITTVIEMPNSVPPVRDVASFHARAEHLAPQAFVDFALWGVVLGDLNREDLAPMAAAGVVGFKLFWGYALDPRTFALVYNFQPGDDVIFPPDEGEIFEAFRAIAKTGKPVAIHAENSAVISRLARAEIAAGGKDYASFLRSRPPFTEAHTTRSGIQLAKAAGVHLHVLHVTAAEAMDEIAAARAAGQAVTAETCPHYLTLTDEDYERLGIAMKVYPPIRERRHQERLWQAVRSGDLQALGSDHAPHAVEEKVGDLWTAPAGGSTIQDMPTVMLNHVSEGRLTLNDVAALLAENPARIWGLYPRKGAVLPGADADLTIVDMDREVTLTSERLVSKSKMSMYAGMRCQGTPVATFVRGRLVMREGELLGDPQGQLVKPVSDPQWRW